MMALLDILFCEEFLFEGEQANAYKRRKAEEKEDAEKKEKEDWHKNNSRYLIGSKPVYSSSKDARENNKNRDLSKKFLNKAEQQAEKKGTEDYDELDNITGSDKDYRVRRDMRRRINQGQKVTQNDYNVAYSTSRRNARRHNNESVILYDNIELV